MGEGEKPCVCSCEAGTVQGGGGVPFERPQGTLSLTSTSAPELLMSATAPIVKPPPAAGDKIAWPREREIPPQGAPLPKGTVVVSADSHVMETSDLWLDRLPAQFKD